MFGLEVGDVEVVPPGLLPEVLGEPVVVHVPGGDLEAGEGGEPGHHQPHRLLPEAHQLGGGQVQVGDRHLGRCRSGVEHQVVTYKVIEIS